MTDKEKLTEMENKLKDNISRENSDFINNFMDVIKEPMKVVPEVVFKEAILPYLMGAKQATEEDDNIRLWISLVGGPNEPAEVRNHKGEMCFVVPGLYNTAIINHSVRTRMNFSKIFKKAEEEAFIHPNAKKKMIMDGIHENLKDRINFNEKKYSWDPVYAYYGLIEEPQANKKEDSNLPPPEDEFDFE